MYKYYTTKKHLNNFRNRKNDSNLNAYFRWILSKIPQENLTENTVQQIKFDYCFTEKYPQNAIPFRFYSKNINLDNYLKKYITIILWRD